MTDEQAKEIIERLKRQQYCLVTRAKFARSDEIPLLMYESIGIETSIEIIKEVMGHDE